MYCKKEDEIQIKIVDNRISHTDARFSFHSPMDIRRRRWINKDTGEYVDRDFHIVAEGTRITQEFATFLKGLRR